MSKKIALGIDIGNVIIDHRGKDPHGRDKKLYDEGYFKIPATKGVFPAIRTLNHYFGGNVYLISKLPASHEEKILNWLSLNGFFESTGVLRNNIFFVRERHEKDEICRKLGITHFIDDRIEVLSHMVKSTPNLYLFQPDKDEVEKFEKFTTYVDFVSSWDEVLDLIINTND